MHDHHPSLAEHSSLVPFIPLLLLAALLLWYLWGVLSLSRKNRNWYSGRTISFICGIFLLGLGVSPAMMEYGHQDFRGHMVQHLFIGMLAPLGLVMGAPVSLALKTWPTTFSRSVTRVLGSSLFHFLSHPLTALVLNIGGMFVLYLTPLYQAMLSHPFLHLFIHFHFLAAGYLFTWSIAGPDPAPRRPGLKLRVAVLFISMAAHAYLSKLMYAYRFPLNSPHSVEEIRAGAKLMYYGGDLSELILAVALFAIWFRRRRQAKKKVALRPAV